MPAFVVMGLAVLLSALPSAAQEDVPFRKPPEEILRLVDVPLPPRTLVDRDARYLVLLAEPGLKTLEELSEPELRLAGLRINPANHNRARTRYSVGIEVREIASGRVIPVTGLPEPARIEYPRFSPGGAYLSFVQVERDGLSLWTVELATGRVSRITPPVLSAVLDTPYRWLPGDRAVIAHVRPTLEPFVETRELPTGPVVQEATGKKAPGRTWQDLLENKADETKFDFYASTEVRRFALDGASSPLLPRAVYRDVSPSPDGSFLLVETVHRPYSYQFPLDRFPYRVEIVDPSGRPVVTLAEKPLQDSIPVAFDAAESGRRDFRWRDDVPATVVWVDALDAGDPAKEVPSRDRLFQWAAPFGGEPKPLATVKNRLRGLVWGEGGLAVATDYRWKDRRVRQVLLDTGRDNPEPRVLFEYSSEALYDLPGSWVTAPNSFDREIILRSPDGKKLYLTGEGYSPEGNRPFLDEYELSTGKTKRLYRADGESTYEQIVRVIEVGKRPVLLTRIESPTRYPDLYLRTVGATKDPLRPLTSFDNPFAALAGVSKQKIKYRREDGVELSADLYLPAGYDRERDGRLPMLLEAYPTEFKDKAAAGMVDSSPHRFVYPRWGSPVFWAVRGYAILENAQFPVVGEGDREPNDTYVEQLVANARAAIRAVDAMGVVDPVRVAVMGHSYGAFMTANLLAHSDLFAAGIARSGAYNRTLTPFGFQAEERTYWEAKEVYLGMSPFHYAEKIDEPILLIHGEADNNPGTFTLQSERLFQAIKGLGGRARLVLLPYESHGYAARENILHMLWEMDAWLERFVRTGTGTVSEKGASPL